MIVSNTPHPHARNTGLTALVNGRLVEVSARMSPELRHFDTCVVWRLLNEDIVICVGKYIGAALDRVVIEGGTKELGLTGLERSGTDGQGRSEEGNDGSNLHFECRERL